MNQILYTGGKSKNRGMVDTKKIVIFFLVFVIIFAICLIGVGINLLSKVKTENPGNNTENPGGITEEPITSDIKINLEAQTNAIKLTVTSNNKISSISYWWDEEEPVALEPGETEFEAEYEAIIESKPGTHQLSISAIDEVGYEKTLTQKVIGKVVDDTEPELTIGTDGINKYVITAKDDEEVTKLVIVLNGETQEIPVNDKEVKYEIDIPQGDSLIEVTVYNLNDLSTKKSAVIKNFRVQ